jgi:predicted aspartyl protease
MERQRGFANVDTGCNGWLSLPPDPISQLKRNFGVNVNIEVRMGNI